MASEVAAAYVSITANTAGLTGGLAAADAKVRGFAGRNDATARRSGNAWRTMGRVATGGLALATVGLGFAVNAAADFEQTMSEVESVTGASGREMGQLEKAALDLGASTKFSAREVAGAQVALGKAGLTTSQIIGGALPASLALAAAGNLELRDAAEFTVKAMDQFGLAGKDTTRIADSFAMAANMTTGDVKDFGMALAQGGAVAKSAGLNFDETMLALTALGKASVFGSDAGTSLKAALVQLINPTKKQAEAAREAGINFLDANGQMKSMTDISAMLRARTEGMTKAQRAQLLATIAGTDGVRTLLALYDAGPQALSQWDRALQTSGTAAKVARVANDNLRGKLEELEGALETIAIKVGTALIPALADGAVAAARFFDGIGESEEVGRIAGQAADALRALAGAAMEGGRTVGPVVAQAARIGADALSALVTIARGGAPIIGTLATGAAGLAQAVLSVVGPVVSVTGAIARLPGVSQGATVALIGLGSAMLTLRAGGAVAGIAGAIGAFTRLAGSVRTASGAAALAGATFPRLAGAVARLTSPAGLAATGIGLLVGGIAALAASSGPTMAERMAASLRNVAREADNAQGAVNRFKGATESLTDAGLAHQGNLIELRAAQRDLNRVRNDASATADDVARAEHRLESAQVQTRRSGQRLAGAHREVREEAADSVTALARLATENGRAAREMADTRQTAEALTRGFNNNGDMARRVADEQANLATQGATTERRMDALRESIRRQAEVMDTNTAAGRETHAILTRIASLDDAGIRRFAGSLIEMERQGKPRAQSLELALDEALKPRTARLSANASAASTTAAGIDNRLDTATRTRTALINARDGVSHMARGITNRINAVPNRTVTITAIDAASQVARNIATAIASIPLTRVTTLVTRPRHETGSPTVYETIDMIEGLARNTLARVTFRPQDSGDIAARYADPPGARSAGSDAHLMARHAQHMQVAGQFGTGGERTVIIHNNVTVVDQTFAGMSNEQTRRVAEQLAGALDRRVTARV